jgi:hypothetical protein
MKLEAVASGSFWALLGFLLNPGAVLVILIRLVRCQGMKD